MKRFLAACIVSLLAFAALLTYARLGGGQIPTEAQELANEASLAYEQGNFIRAAQLYEQAVDHTHQPELFYNLGNAYYRQGDIGRAALNYRRTLALTPRNQDASANLALVKNQALDPFNGSAQGFSNLFTGLNQNELALLALGLWLGSGLLWLGQHITAGKLRVGLQSMLILVALAALLSILSLGCRIYEESHHPTGVIVVQEVQATSGPGTQYPVKFSLHSGTEASIMEKRNEWVRVTLPGSSLQGWIPSTAIEPIR